ncbi:unnamed protein product [Prorocentrum cordatum]|uniref:Uncharacterized protein n=1 Tax=Prorocentrum cordatum TaxID=2364126 RepID=A0ABN9S7D6_9DINO|nr:unnamed protein product [Polarella glacialis]
MLVQAVIKVLEQHGAGFAAPARCFARSWRMFVCTQESPTHALSARPQMHPRALSTQLETFFRNPAVRKSKLQMDRVFTTAPGEAHLIDVKERAIGADPLSQCLALHGSARSALEQADLELSANQEGRAQLAAAKRALAQGDRTVYTLTDEGALTHLNPSRAAGQPAKQARQGIALDDAGRLQARTPLHFWAGSLSRNRCLLLLAAACSASTRRMLGGSASFVTVWSTHTSSAAPESARAWASLLLPDRTPVVQAVHLLLLCLGPATLLPHHPAGPAMVFLPPFLGPATVPARLIVRDCHCLVAVTPGFLAGRRPQPRR